MKQMVLRGGGLETLSLQDGPDAAAPRAGEITIRIRASSLNYHDLMVARKPGSVTGARIPLSDGAGEVLALGEDVTEFAVGDGVVSIFFPDWQEGPDGPSTFARVPGDGIDGYARETVTVPAGWVTRAPRGWSAEESATITTAGLTAWRALVVHGGLKAGDSVAVLGTGGVSLYALQIAKAMGARVIATSSSDAKLERLSALGADAVVNYREVPNWGERIRELTEGRGVDHVVEVGGPGTLAQSIAATRDNGHISLIGVLSGLSGEVPTAALMRKQQRLHGLIVGSRRHQRDFVAALDATGLRPILDPAFPLAELRAAFEHQAAGRHFGKIPILV